MAYKLQPPQSRKDMNYVVNIIRLYVVYYAHVHDRCVCKTSRGCPQDAAAMGPRRPTEARIARSQISATTRMKTWSLCSDLQNTWQRSGVLSIVVFQVLHKSPISRISGKTLNSSAPLADWPSMNGSKKLAAV